jgi:hypothetical protein
LGVSSGGSVAAALELSQTVENAVIVAIGCDRGDRYLSSGVFNEESVPDASISDASVSNASVSNKKGRV